MSLDASEVKKIAFLARLEVSDDHLDSLAEELNGILHWVEQLGEVDTDGVKPMTGVTDLTQRLREDRVTDGHYPDKVIGNAPDKVAPFYAVPKVVE